MIWNRAIPHLALAAAFTLGGFAQGPPSYRPADLDQLVSRVALYPDPLLSNVLAAATYPDQIPDAARWADDHHYLTGDSLAAAISADQLPWDESVQALLPFPPVLDLMANDMNWTQSLGDAFLAQQGDVMDAVQRMRRRAYDYGYLRPNPEVQVVNGPYIEILPVNTGLWYVPYYDPLVVFAAPRPGFVIGGAIRFGYSVRLGPAFRPYGWGSNRFAWNSRTVYINNAPWRRTWNNRATYVHPNEPRGVVRPAPRPNEMRPGPAPRPNEVRPGPVPRPNEARPGVARPNEMRPAAPRPPERHQLEPRTPTERDAGRMSRPRVEDHRAPAGRSAPDRRGGRDEDRKK